MSYRSVEGAFHKGAFCRRLLPVRLDASTSRRHSIAARAGTLPLPKAWPNIRQRAVSSSPQPKFSRGFAANNRVVKLLSRMDENEELPRARVFGPAASPEEIAARPAIQHGPLGAHVSLFIAESKLPGAEGGRGVFVGQDVAAGAVVEVCPVLSLRRDHIDVDCSGMHYFFAGPNGDDLLCVLGFGMLYNHSPSPPWKSGHRQEDKAEGKRYANLTYSLREAPGSLRDSRDGGICVRFEAARDLMAGEELFIDYSEHWWRSKGLRPV